MKGYQPGDHAFSQKTVELALNEFHETGKKSDLLCAMMHKHRLDSERDKAEFRAQNESFTKAYELQARVSQTPLFNSVRYGLFR